jgi:hypothetical protein
MIAVARSQVKVQRGGALYVHAFGGAKLQLKESATAAQAAIMMSEAKRVNKQYSQALSKEYLKDPTSLMKLYLALVSLLVKWVQFQPSLFAFHCNCKITVHRATSASQWHGTLPCQISPILLPSDVDDAWKILLGRNHKVGNLHGAGDSGVSA